MIPGNTKKILVAFFFIFFLSGCADEELINLEEVERERVLTAAEKYLNEEPVTITDFEAERSLGGIHDFYSEGDYWWENPEDPEGPYIRKDGMTNPDNFTEHRKTLRRMSIIVPTLIAAYKITGDEKYAEAAIKHIEAWFVNPDTRMNANLLYAQAIKGKVSGRGIGIIDTIHLAEVAQALIILERSGYEMDEIKGIKNWFSEYLNWLTTHQFGIDERYNGNNHSTAWTVQVGAYSKFVDDEAMMDTCREFYKNVLLPDQMAEDGSFPLELERTKPYGYSIFNLDMMTAVVQILSDDENDLWHYETDDGKSIGRGIEFLYPYIKNKELWDYPEDVMYYEDWPVRQPFLLFGGINLNEPKYIEIWKKLEPDPIKEEVIRNFPIRQPVLWIEQ